MFLGVGAAFGWWARDTLTKTLLNRRLSWTFALHFVVQMLLGTGAWLGGLSPVQSLTLHVLSWALTQGLLAVWLERWFGWCAAICAASFLVASARPGWLFPLMALDNLFFTAAVVFVWLPRQDIAAVNKRRLELRKRARRMFLEAVRPQAAGDEDSP